MVYTVDMPKTDSSPNVRRMLSVTVDEATERELDELARATGEAKALLVRLAIHRLYEDRHNLARMFRGSGYTEQPE